MLTEIFIQIKSSSERHEPQTFLRPIRPFLSFYLVKKNSVMWDHPYCPLILLSSISKRTSVEVEHKSVEIIRSDNLSFFYLGTI